MILKKLSMLLVFLALLFACSSCGQGEKTETSSTTAQSTNSSTEIWTAAQPSICAWFDEADSGDSMGINTDPLTIRIGKNADDKNTFSLVRLPMSATWFSDEIANARLYLKTAAGKPPSAFRIGLIRETWGYGTVLSGAMEIAGSAETAAVSVRQERDGWVSIDITDYVAHWVNSDVPNYGLVFLAENAGDNAAFFSGWDGSGENPPRLEVTGTVRERALDFGKYGYLRHPENEADDALIESGETTNCLSYALRDTNMITDDDLDLDYDEMTRIRRESGEDAVTDYCARRVEDYVEKHKAGLQISGFRRIDGFDAEIDPEKEYRIALRTGAKLYYDDDILNKDDGNFDYHLYMQLNNGQWAQKFMFSPSETIPGSGPGIPPDKYPWDASLTWDIEAFKEFYTSKTAYFAVTKEANGFTEHKENSSEDS